MSTCAHGAKTAYGSHSAASANDTYNVQYCAVCGKYFRYGTK